MSHQENKGNYGRNDKKACIRGQETVRVTLMSCERVMGD